ncbi:MAG: hypothetical protein K2K84_08570, partial [Muribaculaceae bacterium]|nr:hypothetical protein [Muribaculaceae bacterium]
AILYPTTAKRPLNPKPDRRNGDPVNLLHTGPLEKLATLSASIDVMTDLGETNPLELTVLTTGQARYVMPIVRRARANKIPVDWKGDEYDFEKELEKADAILAADPPHLSPREVRALLSRRPLLYSVRDLSDLANGDTEELKARSEKQRLNHQPRIYIDSLRKIIKP